MNAAASAPIPPGPLEETPFPNRLTARVVTPGTAPRIHGYDVERDLAVHYGIADLVLLTLTGELPREDQAALFELTWMFLAPVSVAHASTHAAVLARLCGASTSANLGAGAIALGEQARVLLDEHEDLLAWLEAGSADLPVRHRTTVSEEASDVERFAEALASKGLTIPALSLLPTRSAALLIALHRCGLTQRAQMEAAIVFSRLPSAIAEAFSESVANFRSYPINLPRFRYEESA